MNARLQQELDLLLSAGIPESDQRVRMIQDALRAQGYNRTGFTYEDEPGYNAGADAYGTLRSGAGAVGPEPMGTPTRSELQRADALDADTIEGAETDQPEGYGGDSSMAALYGRGYDQYAQGLPGTEGPPSHRQLQNRAIAAQTRGHEPSEQEMNAGSDDDELEIDTENLANPRTTEEELDMVRGHINRGSGDPALVEMRPFSGDVERDRQILLRNPDAYDLFVELHGEENVPRELNDDMPEPE